MPETWKCAFRRNVSSDYSPLAILALLFDVPIPVKTVGRDALVHPKTVFLDHWKAFRAHDLQRHTVDNGAWQNPWQDRSAAQLWRLGRINYGNLPGRGRILQSLNLKNPRAYSLASELSHITGESLTATVIIALEQRLEAERRKRGGSTTAERILAFAGRFAPGMAPGSRSADHAAELYGDDGMPR